MFSSIRMLVQSAALAVLLLAVLPSSCLSSPPNPQFSGYELLQFHKDRGEVVLDVCPRGIKTLTKKTNMVTVCTPPDWKVVAYSARTNKMFSIDLQHFIGEDRMVFLVTGTPQFNNIPLKTAGQGAICGIPVEKYNSTDEFSLSQLSAFHRRAASGGFPCKVSYCVSSKLAMQPEFAQFIYRFYQLPKTNGVALQLTYDSINCGKFTELITHTCRPRIFASDDFKPPTVYKKVKSLTEVQADITDQAEAQTLIDSFDDVRKIKLHR